MSDPEVISEPRDNRIEGLPREGSRRISQATAKPPSLWTLPATWDYAGEWGALPRGFLAVAARTLRADPREVLHVCSGAIPAGHGRARVDLRASTRPDVRADGRALPFADATFAAVLMDPPYSVEYARDLYGTSYPRPSALLREAVRVVRPGGRVGIVHFLVPMPVDGCQLVLVRGLTTGCGYRIRAFTVFEREQAPLPFEAGAGRGV